VIQRLTTRFTQKQLIGGAVLLGLVLLAAGLSIYQIGLKKPAGAPTVIVRQMPAIPADPWDKAWTKRTAVLLPLSIVSTPGAAARQVNVRGLTDGTTLALRVEWADSSQELYTLRPQDFGDQTAIMMTDVMSQACMGQLDIPVHIWQWKADWQYGSRDMLTQFPNLYADGYWSEDGKQLLTEDLFSRPAFAAGNPRAAFKKENAVEHLLAGGFGTLTSAGPSPMVGKGVWQDGKWAVIYTRPLKAAGEVTLAPGAPLQAAFAVWDGKLMQRDGMKYVTSWTVLQMEAAK